MASTPTSGKRNSGDCVRAVLRAAITARSLLYK
jgi:hypothetical protein